MTTVRMMRITVSEEIEQRILNLAAAQEIDVETEIIQLLTFALMTQEYYIAHKLQEHMPEQV